MKEDGEAAGQILRAMKKEQRMIISEKEGPRREARYKLLNALSKSFSSNNSD